MNYDKDFEKWWQEAMGQEMKKHDDVPEKIKQVMKLATYCGWEAGQDLLFSKMKKRAGR